MKFYKLTAILCAFILALSICPNIAQAEEAETVSVPIIMYHSLLDKKTNQWNISPEAFEKDLRYLRENDYHAVFISDLVDYIYKNKPLPDKPVVLTFDDGYYNNYTKMMPLLEKYDAKIVLSVIGSNTDTWTEHPDDIDERYGHVTWPHISEMYASGRVELANHTQDLHKNSNRDGCRKKRGEDLQAYEKILSEDLNCLQKKFEEVCGVNPICFTYPFGSICVESVDILKNLGFKASLSSASGINQLTADDPDCLYRLKRNNRTPDSSAEKILNALRK